MGTYLDGKRGSGGIYNSFNLGLYNYTHLNPLRYIDPDGNSPDRPLVAPSFFELSTVEGFRRGRTLDQAAGAGAGFRNITAPAASAALIPAASGTVVTAAAALGEACTATPACAVSAIMLGDLLDLNSAADGGPVGRLAPSKINFSQRTVSGNVEQYVRDMKAGNWDWNKSGPIRIMQQDGKWVSYDNRRLMAAQQAGLNDIPYEVVDPKAIMPGSKKTWEQAFNKRFNDQRNVSAGGAVPPGGLSTQPEIAP